MSEQNFEQQMKKLRRDLAFTRVVCILTSVVTLLLICGGGYLFWRMQGILENAQPILEQVAEVDIENVNETLWQIRTTLETVDLEQAVETLDELDIDALNSAIEGLDTTELSEALSNLNDAVESLQRVEDSFGSVFGR